MASRSISRVRWNIYLLLLALLLLSWGCFVISFAHEFQTIEQQSSQQVSNLALGLEERSRRMLQVLDMLLLDIAEHLQYYQPKAVNSMFSLWLKHTPELSALLIVDPDTGQILTCVNKGPLPEGLSFSLMTNTENSDSPMQITEKVYRDSHGRNLGAMVRQFSRSGRQLQVVALVQIDHLLDFHKDAALGPDGSVAIFHHSGVLLARTPAGNDLVGRSFADGPLFTRHLKKAPVGISRAPRSTDGVSRIVAHRKLSDFPLVVTVGTSTEWIFAAWQKRLYNVLFILGAVSLTILISMLILHRTLARMERAEDKLNEREEHFRAVADSSVDAVLSVNDSERIGFWSRGAEQIFACSAAEAVGMPISCFLQFEFEENPVTLKQLTSLENSWIQGRAIEVQGQRKDGWLFPTELSISTGNAAGKPFYTLIVRNISERKQIEERIRRMASHDNLTRLPNRRLLMDRLNVAMAQVRRRGGQFAVLFLDLDEFKPINDRYGHDVGDQLLQQVAERLLAATRESDTVARVGGDEFALLLSNIEDEESVRNACQHILKSLRKKFTISGIEASISCSIGVALFNGQGTSGNELIGHADMAMYTAKRGGKNRFAFAAESGNRSSEN